MKIESVKDSSAGAGWRIKIGFTVFILSITWPVLIPVLPFIGFSNKSVAAVTGFMFVVAEVMMITAAAIAGKDGFAYIKLKVFSFFKLYTPSRGVSVTRYRIGLIMFTVPLFYSFLSPYIEYYWPGFGEYRIINAIAGDFLLLVGLFLLGGNFWEKLQSLFIHKAIVTVSNDHEEGL
ncbi:transporter suffix domain-containing protein [Desulfogranum marinum]|uniref:transporter suffix domain-containing protein n=1 Tax=Desulfogranum marinum TaxID=453220 RepID=UPI0019629605|nr:transporter suffix domain-containing protein [Desulfogranum marinum]MBM9515258.1 transporter suffix domain-containing protein [Desulfogranum marinum]